MRRWPPPGLGRPLRGPAATRQARAPTPYTAAVLFLLGDGVASRWVATLSVPLQPHVLPPAFLPARSHPTCRSPSALGPLPRAGCGASLSAPGPSLRSCRGATASVATGEIELVPTEPSASAPGPRTRAASAPVAFARKALGPGSCASFAPCPCTSTRARSATGNRTDPLAPRLQHRPRPALPARSPRASRPFSRVSPFARGQSSHPPRHVPRSFRSLGASSEVS
mmetsp:Transcript_71573/g.198660  ORF Transcript_71573/g.198660 Transcript_71573/m.198660 type:complete len:225 (-) Transcript_71573:669-1343(-)